MDLYFRYLKWILTSLLLSLMSMTGLWAEEAAINATTASSGWQNNELKAASKRGEKIYQAKCIACHKSDGAGMPPIFPPLKGNKFGTNVVSDHIHIVLNGRPGTAMRDFKDDCSDEDIADVITYELNAWGNNTGTLVIASEVQAARK
ncbi:cytochrome c oxidase subunit II [Legionella beliardensis]|uniref:Cytochrome c oxidase subunit II n=1 Tax=Legionella beliardensis TaxID=91822 RepID=A0A378HYJ8_9GAMM|nr:cytochrome c [Legionella beliardensis]STX27977.1 cytochrome c oxidase subunit II [Legionella beliardensis]